MCIIIIHETRTNYILLLLNMHKRPRLWTCWCTCLELYDRKETLQTINTASVTKVANSQKIHAMLDDCPPPINDTEKHLITKKYGTPVQLRTGHFGILGSNMSRIKKDTSLKATAAMYHMRSNISSFVRSIRMV